METVNLESSASPLRTPLDPVTLGIQREALNPPKIDGKRKACSPTPSEVREWHRPSASGYPQSRRNGPCGARLGADEVMVSMMAAEGSWVSSQDHIWGDVGHVGVHDVWPTLINKFRTEFIQTSYKFSAREVAPPRSQQLSYRSQHFSYIVWLRFHCRMPRSCFFRLADRVVEHKGNALRCAAF